MKSDFFVALGLFILSIIFSLYFDIFDYIHEISRIYEDFEIDELLPIIFFSSLISIWFAYRRIKENKKLIDELKKLNETLEKRIEEKLKSERRKDKVLIKQSKIISMAELMSNISHHWRQPLNVISIAIQKIILKYASSKEITDKDIENLQKNALEQIDFLSKTIDNFRNFFISSNAKEDFNLKETIEFSLLMLENELKDKNIAINIINCNFNIYSYKNEFIQVILNLLKNACEAIILKREKEEFTAKIDISSIKENEKLIISIKDNGIGIKEEIIDKIYEPYFSTKFAHKGIGVGLFMVKEIIEREIKGEIYVKSTKESTEFIIKLPLTEIA